MEESSSTAFSRSWVKSLFLPTASLFLMGLLVHGIYVTKLGFYWDDWCLVWVYHALGVKGILEYTAGERPVQGWFYALLTSCIGISPVPWHLLALVTRCASPVAIFIALCGIWPKLRDLAWCTALFAMLYPGFTQQSIAMPYFPDVFAFLLFSISLAATIFSIQVPAGRCLLLPLSWVAGAFAYLTTEYFVGLEFLRLAVIAFLICSAARAISYKTIKSVVVQWGPCAAIFVLCIGSRSFVKTVAFYGGAATNSKDVRAQLSQIFHHPTGEMLHRASGAIHNILMGGLFAWVRPLTPALIDWHSRSVILSWFVGALMAGISLIVLGKARWSYESIRAPGGNQSELQTSLTAFLILGLFGIGVAGLPVTVGDCLISFDGSPAYQDRFSLPFLLGASMVLAGLLYTVFIRRHVRNIVIALLVFSYCAFNIEQANQYRRDWQAQRSLFWQMAWRAPDLKLGTSVYIDGLCPTLFRNHAAGLLNLLYIGDDSAGKLDYFIFDLPWLKRDQLAYAEMKLSYKPQDPIGGRLRVFNFSGTNSQSLVCWLSPSGTLRILDPPYDSEVLDASALCRNISYLSHPERVIMNRNMLPSGPLLLLMGPEPRHEWHYFYQKAELERQLGRWAEVAKLGEEARKRGFTPVDATEWLSFVEGYARSNQFDIAVELTRKILDGRPDAVRPLSIIWTRVGHEDKAKSAGLTKALDQLRDRLMLSE